MKIYKASMDTLGKIVTLVVLVIVLSGAATSVIYTLTEQTGPDNYITILSTVAIVAIFGITWFFAPRAYHLTSNELIIDRPWKPVKISLNQIQQVSQPDMSEFAYMLRLFGSGGFLGYFGLFWAAKTGRMWWYATKRTNLIMITLPDSNPIMLSPDDITLADELRKWAKTKI